jgi:hypothetical protein
MSEVQPRRPLKTQEAHRTVACGRTVASFICIAPRRDFQLHHLCERAQRTPRGAPNQRRKHRSSHANGGRLADAFIRDYDPQVYTVSFEPLILHDERLRERLCKYCAPTGQLLPALS